MSIQEISGIILTGGKSRRIGFNKLSIRLGGVPLFMDQVFKLSFFCNEILLITSEENIEKIDNEICIINNYIKLYNFDTVFKIPPLRIIKDIYTNTKKTGIETYGNDGTNLQGFGPVIGIYTGLINSQNNYSIVLACDMPFISYRLLKLMESCLQKNYKRSGPDKKNPFNSGRDAYIIKTEKGFEALCSLYSKKCTAFLEDNILKGFFKISDIFASINAGYIGIRDLELRNIDMLNFFNINNLEDYDFFIKILKIPDNTQDFACKWRSFFYR